MNDKKIYLLMFFLSIELLMVGVFTLSNSFALSTDTSKIWNIGYIVNGEKTDIININTNIQDEYVLDVEVYNEGNIDAYYDSLKLIGDTSNLDISIDNKKTLFAKDKELIKIKIKLKDPTISNNVDIGVSLLYKELKE